MVETSGWQREALMRKLGDLKEFTIFEGRRAVIASFVIWSNKSFMYRSLDWLVSEHRHCCLVVTIVCAGSLKDLGWPDGPGQYPLHMLCPFTQSVCGKQRLRNLEGLLSPHSVALLNIVSPENWESVGSAQDPWLLKCQEYIQQCSLQVTIQYCSFIQISVLCKSVDQCKLEDWEGILCAGKVVLEGLN